MTTQAERPGQSAVLRMQGTEFVQNNERAAGPIDLELAEGGRIARVFPTAREAAIAAMMAAAVVKATAGNVFIEEFDPRIQPVQCKRIVGYVPHEIPPFAFSSFEEYIEYRAALWSLEPTHAIVRAKLLLERLNGIHESFAYPLAGALIASPRILVLDRPQSVYAKQIFDIADTCAIFSTHISTKEAAFFA